MDGSAVSKVAINAVGGALTTLSGTILSRQIIVVEDGSGAAAGLIYYLLNPANPLDPLNPTWVGPFQVAAGIPITLGDPPTLLGSVGSMVSKGPDVKVGVGVTPALPYMQIKSAGAATVIRIVELS